MSLEIRNAIKEINLTKTTALLNTIGFLGYGMDEFNFSYDNRLKENEKRAIKYSSLLLTIAGVHYTVLDVSNPSIKSEMIIRYSDWILTTPLLLLTISEYYELSSEISTKLVVYNIIMIFFGFMYEITSNYVYWAIGTLAYFKIVHDLYTNLPETDLFYKYFVFGWSFYGVISLLPAENRILYYNILDGYNKLVFAANVRSKIIKDVNDRNQYVNGRNQYVNGRNQ